MSKTFATQEMQLNDVLLLQDAVDPTAGGGVVAPIGSKYWRGTATAGDFTKTGAANTAWTGVAQGIYFNVKDPAYGAAGDGVTNDRAAIQKAIDDASAAGGTIYFPPGTYLCGKNGGNPYSFLLDGVNNVRFLGCGWGGSVLKQSGNAALGAYNLFRFQGSCDSCEFELLTFDQGGLTNPGVDQCHLINLLSVSVFKLNACRFGSGVANAGAYVHVGGTAGQDAEIVWVNDCFMENAGGPCVWIDGGASTVWVIDNDLLQSNAEDNTIFVDDSTGDLISDIKIQNNYVINAVQYGIRFPGSTQSSRCQIQNNIVQGFVAVANLFRSQFQHNEVFASVAALASAVVTISDSTEMQVQKSAIGRESTCAAGLCLLVDGCNKIQIQTIRWLQETQAGFLRVVDTSNVQIQHVLGNASNAGASANDAILVEADTVNIDNIQISNPMISADAGTWLNAIRILSSGQTIGVVQVVPGILDNCATGVNFDDGGGGIGMFSQPNLLMIAGGIIDATIAAWSVPTGLYLRVAGNASTFGPNIIAGNGTPEGNVTARVGSMFMRLDGGAATTLYVKESGSGNTGWTGK